MSKQLHLDMDELDKERTLWEAALDAARDHLGSEAVESWLGDARAELRQAGVFRVTVGNGTAREWIVRKYSSALRGILRDLDPGLTSLEVTVRQEVESRPAPTRKSLPEAASSRAASHRFPSLPIGEKYTFDSFVVGGSNRFAHAAATAVAARPGQEYNPLFIYGGVGLGKTHLLQAIGHARRKEKPGARIAYVSGETFTTHFVNSIREHREEEFRRHYRSVDVWLVDDIQFVADKTGTREEFFHTFNELFLTTRQIVLCADRPPRDLHLMEDRLRSRLECGLMVEVAPPELETRVAILERRALSEGVTVPAEVLFQLANAVPANIRVLEAALIRTIALASLTRAPFSPELAHRALSAFVAERTRETLGPDLVVAAVAREFEVEVDAILGPGRSRSISRARQVAMYLVRELCRVSLVDIGRHFGGKTHSTVVYSCGRLEEALAADVGLGHRIEQLRRQLCSGAVSVQMPAGKRCSATPGLPAVSEQPRR